jgi:putative spermidine/putrescine transport system ATP-binding protein
VAVLKDGRLLQLASPREIYEHPASKAVAEFVGLSTLVPGTVTAPGRVDTGFAVLAAETGARPAGARVTVLVRPEHVVVDPDPAMPNVIAGRVGTERYLGSIVRYDFHVQGLDRPILGEAHVAPRHSIGIPPQHVQLLDT